MIEKEELEKRMDRIIEWVKVCDTKTSIMLSVISVLLTIMFTSDTIVGSISELMHRMFDKHYYLYDGIDVLGIIALLSLLLTCISVLYSLYKFIKVLHSKKNETLTGNDRGFLGFVESYLFYKKSIVKTDSHETSSLIHFNHIASLSYDDFCNLIKKSENENQWKDDLISQIHINAIRCNEKFEDYNDGIVLLMISVLLGIITAISFSVYYL